MKLDEAIKHCEEKARDCSECAKEHEQLAQWLKELKQLKSQIMVNDYYPCRYCKAYACWECRYKMDQLHIEPFDKLVGNKSKKIKIINKELL